MTKREMLRARDALAYERFSNQAELPMTVLALVLLPVVAIPLVFEVSAVARMALEIISWLIWVAFVVEFLVKLYLAPRRRDMVRTHILDLICIVVPFLRPLRALRAVRLVRVVGGVGRALLRLGRVTNRRGFRAFVLVVGAAILAGSVVAWVVERNQPDVQFDEYYDALWWAIVMGTTIGDAGVAPVSIWGKAIGIVLMMLRVCLLAMITAQMAAAFVEQDEERSQDDMTARLDRIERLLARVAVDDGSVTPHSTGSSGVGSAGAPTNGTAIRAGATAEDAGRSEGAGATTPT
ncbi:MAG: ion transporter [Actinomycetota bacterium]|nr:ion transporter [Actinomycetota bacterium]